MQLAAAPALPPVITIKFSACIVVLPPRDYLRGHHISLFCFGSVTARHFPLSCRLLLLFDDRCFCIKLFPEKSAFVYDESAHLQASSGTIAGQAVLVSPCQISC
jgi:hypothetical protein